MKYIILMKKYIYFQIVLFDQKIYQKFHTIVIYQIFYCYILDFIYPTDAWRQMESTNPQFDVCL